MMSVSTQHQHGKKIFEALSIPSTSKKNEQGLIKRSWQRCIDRYGFDPSRPTKAHYVTPSTLREHQDEADDLLQVARAGVEQLYRHVLPLGYVVLLVDARGIVVQFLGSRENDYVHQKTGLYLGADWSEENTGTSAVGICIHEREPVTCHHTDHFSIQHIRLTCTAAPIFDSEGELLAVLNISSYNSPKSKTSQTFSLQLVKHYAKMIENAYFLKKHNKNKILCLDHSREFVQINRRYLISMDEEGGLIATNSEARKLLIKHDCKLPTLEDNAILNKVNIADILDAETKDILTIQSYCDDGVRAFNSRNNREIYFGTLIEPQKIKKSENKNRQHYDSTLTPLEALAGDDPSMRDTLKRAARLRNEPINILLLGETGTGKERIAQAIHDSSRRYNKPFIAINCAAIPESLIESELFGYEPGSFTGGNNKGMKGLICQADGGTLFLDEIGDMPVNLQTRLLRVLSEQEVLPIGASHPIKVDIRVVAATHHELRNLITKKFFREDLFYRLNGATLRLPPLRDRVDKGYIIKEVLSSINRGRKDSIRIRGDAMSALIGYSWPGNIRELHNVLKYAVAICDDGEVISSDLPEELLYKQNNDHPTADYYEGDFLQPCVSKKTTSSFEKNNLYKILSRHQWNISSASRDMKVSRTTIYRKMKQLGVVPPNKQIPI